MLELKDLKKLVKEGEGSKLEFKLKSTHPDKIMREVVAFANTQGGTLLLGVADNGELSGLKFPDEDAFVMERSFAKFIYPPVHYSKQEIQLENGRPILAYHIRKSEEHLIYFNPTGDSSDRKVYVRNADRSIQASKEVREILKERLKEKNYRFHYGEKEEILMKYLDQHGKITVNIFSKVADIPLKQASKTLILLVLARVLQVFANESEDQFALA
ncbi:helix-turn-helix domain-containing protein [Leadbetterella byssophila]|jgi:predicted HTH transcriptional regulator|uniref:AlbA family DNA-binding domain-containing protein n=1 Tax=Leadbetterella byssophila TaxID=316068 RepID=UPI0039A0727B